MDDQHAAAVINAVELPAAGALAWFGAVCEVASARPGDWGSFIDQLRAVGTRHDSSIDDSVIDRFVENLEQLTGSPLSVVMELAEHGPYDLAALYGKVDAVPQSTAWDWVTDDQRDRLRRDVGDHWVEAVSTTFDRVWPGWEGADDTTKTTTLDQWIDTIAGQSGLPQPDDGAAAVVVDERLQSDIATALEADGLSLTGMDATELDRILQDAARLARAAKTSRPATNE